MYAVLSNCKPRKIMLTGQFLFCVRIKLIQPSAGLELLHSRLVDGFAITEHGNVPNERKPDDAFRPRLQHPEKGIIELAIPSLHYTGTWWLVFQYHSVCSQQVTLFSRMRVRQVTYFSRRSPQCLRSDPRDLLQTATSPSGSESGSRMSPPSPSLL
jgi:hypothetical protein